MYATVARKAASNADIKAHAQDRAFMLRAEVARIANVTLRGTFANTEDRTYWVGRLSKLNRELSALEQQIGATSCK